MGVCVRGVVGEAEGDRVMRREGVPVELPVELLLRRMDAVGVRVEILVGVRRLLGVCVLETDCVREDVRVCAARLWEGKEDLE